MGSPDYITSFQFNVTKVAGQPVFTVHSISGDSSKVEYTSHTVNTVKFSLSDNRGYTNQTVQGFNKHAVSTTSEFNTISSSYTIQGSTVSSDSVEIKLVATNSNVTSLSWTNMLSNVAPGFVTSGNVIVRNKALTTKQTVDNPFRYITMESSNSIANNGVYVNQDAESVYFDNNTIPITVTYKSLDNLSNSNGEYRLDVVISEDGVVLFSDTYMPYVSSYEWIDGRLHITTTVSPLDYTGLIMSNINYNGQHIIHNDLIVETDSTGLLVSNVNYDMSFTLLVTITSH